MSDFTLATLTDLTRNSVTLSATADLTPTAGEGAPIAPPTFASGSGPGSHPGGPAITENTIQRFVDDEGTPQVRRDLSTGAPLLGNSVLVDTVFSQSTRGESALWNLRDKLDLPGIVFNTPEDSAIEEAVAKQYGKVAGGKNKTTPVQNPEAAVKLITNEMKAVIPSMSSWTLAHRHVDGVIRSASTDGGKTVWHDGGELYDRLVAAGPQALLDLLHLSPNSVLFGFWASSMPVRHRLARSFTSTVTGYGAHRMTGGALKATPFDITSHLEISDAGDVKYTEKPNEKRRPSNWGLGAVPASGSNLVTCDAIIGDAAVTVGQLRRVLHNSDLTDDQADKATIALTGLGMLAHNLVLEDGFYRSGCDLVDQRTTWRSIHRGRTEQFNVPDTQELIGVVRESLDAARSVDAFGSASDRIKLDLGPTMLEAVVASYIEQMVKNVEEGDA